MEKKKFGNPLIRGILMMLIILLVVFLIYEIIFVDVFRIFHKRDDSISITQNENKNNKKDKENIQETDVIVSLMGNTVQNTENQLILDLDPITDNNQNNNQDINFQDYTHYYYNQLDDDARIIYKGLEDNIDNMVSGNYKIDFGNQFSDLLNQENGEEKLNIAFQSAWNAFTYDNVDIFYIDVTKLVLVMKKTTIGNYSTYQVSLSNGDNENYYTKQITSSEDLIQRKQYIENVRKNIVQQIEGHSQYDQIKSVHDWMVNSFKYDATSQKDDIHNVYGAFKNKEVVCEGYARTFKYILDGLGIESVLVSGEATNSEGKTESHAWNYVKINEKWYAIDVTWDDPVITGGGTLTDNIRYKYFLKGSNEFFKNHKEDGYVSNNTIEFTFPILEKGNYTDV